MINLLSFKNAKRNKFRICARLNGTKTRFDKTTRKHEYPTDSATFLINRKLQHWTSKAWQFLSALINYLRFRNGSFGTKKCTLRQWTEHTSYEPADPANSNFLMPLPLSGKLLSITFTNKRKTILDVGNKFPTQQTNREQNRSQNSPSFWGES